MQNEDTKGILQECDSGVKMGIDSIDEVIDRVGNPALRQALLHSRTEHVQLQNEIATALDAHGWSGKDPSPVADVMSRLKIKTGLTMQPTDAKIADLMIDGCDMGIKKLSQYVNRFPASDSPAVHIAERLIKSEQELADAMRVFL
ncbi:MAG: spore coat protein [Clostridia bacterium]|nr:spore coat protein [Clostridia bacterium]